MAIDVYSDYRVLPWQERMHSGRWMHACLAGGKGTSDIDTRIFDAELGAYVSIRWLLENRRRPCVLSWTNDGWKKIWASSPYLEGIGPMFRVTLRSGKSISVSGFHRFLTQRGFVRTLDLTLRDSVFGPKNLPSKHPYDVSNDLFDSQTALDLTGHYWRGLGQYDGRFLSQSDVAQEFFPSSAGQLCDALIDTRETVRDHKKGSTRLPGILPLDDRIVFFYYEASDGLVRADRADQVLYEFDRHSSQAWQEILSGESKDLEPTLVCPDRRHNALWEYRNISSNSEFSEGARQRLWPQETGTDTCSVDPKQIPSLHAYRQAAPSSSKPPVIKLSEYDDVVAVVYLGHRAYFDLHVPETNNYVAEGMVHHNSGKTRSGIEELKMCAWEFPGSDWLIGRKTLPSLKDTTYKEFLATTPDDLIKDHNKSDRNVTLVNGSRFLFRPLDEPKKFDSLEIAGFLIDEADEIDKEVYDTLKTRVRQVIKAEGKRIYPRYRTILILNPCEETHWIPQLFLHTKPPDHQLFNSSAMDNIENLPAGYVDQLKSVYSEDMQQRMIYGMFGKVHKGNPVFPQFSRGNFIRPIEPVEKHPIYRGWDFGFNHPSCVWLQFIDGQVRVLAEKLGHKIYLDDFIQKDVAPMQASLWGEWPVYKDFCDPRGSDESDKGKSSVDILNDHGIYPIYRRTFIEEGIKAIKGLLDTHNNGEPNLLIHGRCRMLIEGFRGGYHRLDGEDAPEKDNLYDHLFDALRYCCVHLTRRHKFNQAQSVINNQNRFIHPVTGRIREY